MRAVKGSVQGLGEKNCLLCIKMPSQGDDAWSLIISLHVERLIR